MSSVCQKVGPVLAMELKGQAAGVFRGENKNGASYHGGEWSGVVCVIGALTDFGPDVRVNRENGGLGTSNPIGTVSTITILI